MTLGRKLNELKALFSDISPSQNGIQDGPWRPAGPGGLSTNAHDFAVNNPIMNYVHGNQYNIAPTAGDRHMIVTQMMTLLSKHIIRGAEHDSCARDPPPRCHPETRVKLIARIIAWFEDQASLELLLWITGPAGVGKSAIVQTFAEYLVKSHLLGASVFLSRPYKRDNPHGVFITIAYQLATRIEAYRAYIVEQLRLDPELPSRGMQAQFVAFIVEPFVEKKIGAGGRRWGILLDGLDELRGSDAQCEIIRLVSSFVHEHPNAPLAWIIASRAESHISNVFEDDEVRGTYWSEYIPIDSTEACADVERFLRSSLKRTQKKFRHRVSRDWPSKTDFLKLTATASGDFIYAQVMMRFIGDSDHADPVARFQVLLSAIDSPDAPLFKENFRYKAILSSTPSKLWPMAKQLLGFTIYKEQISAILPHNLQDFDTLRGMSILFGTCRNDIYTCLDKCGLELGIPDWNFAHKEGLTFLHPSFADYLRDSSKSEVFHVGDVEDVEKNVILSLLRIWDKCSGDDIAAIQPMWHQYCSKWDDEPPSRDIANFYAKIFHRSLDSLGPVVHHILQDPEKSRIYVPPLRKLHIRKLSYHFDVENLRRFAISLLKFSPKPSNSKVFRVVQLRELEFGHLDWKEMSPSCAYYGMHGKIQIASDWILHQPHSRAEFKVFMSELESLQNCLPELKVVIVGGVSNERVAVFDDSLDQGIDDEDFIYYVIPYP